MERGFGNLTLRFSGINAGYYFSQMVFFGYLGSILRYFGYGETFIGTMQSVGALVALILNLVLGYLEDRYGYPKRMLIILYTLYAVMQVALFAFGENEAFAVAFAVAGLGSVRPLIGVFESWQLKLNEKYSLSINYGRVRGIGSLAYAVIGLVAGVLIGRFGYEACIYIVAFSWAVIMLSCIGIPDIKSEPAGRPEQQVGLRDGARVLFRNEGYVVLLVVMLLGSITNMTVAGNFSMIVSDAPGGSADLAGIGFFVMAFSEFWVMYFSSDIAGRLGFDRMFVIGLAGYTVKSVAMVLAPTAGWVIGVQLMQTFSFAFVGPASIAMLDRLISGKYKSVGVQLLYMVQSLTSVLLNSLIGYIYESYGYRVMLAVFSPLSFIGAAILLCYLLRQRRRQRALQNS